MLPSGATSSGPGGLDRRQQFLLCGRQPGRCACRSDQCQKPVEGGAQLEQIRELGLLEGGRIVGRSQLMDMPNRAKSLAHLLTPEAGGAVMATGIVSVALHFNGHETLSLALLVVTAAAWTALGVLFVGRLCFDRVRWRHDAERPSSLTAVAGTAVLGARLTLLGWSWGGWVLLAVASSLCLVLLSTLARFRSRSSTGTGFLVVVAPQSLAVLAAALSQRMAVAWLAAAALFPFAYGLGAYALVLGRFDFGELRIGAGDQWVSGGALAISTLACAELAQVISTKGTLDGLHDPLRLASLVLWGLTMTWLPALIGGEVRWPRPRYEVRRWATVFPLGMYSVMSFSVGAEAGSSWISDFARGCAWVALAAWAATTVGLAGRITRTRRASDRSRPDRRA